MKRAVFVDGAVLFKVHVYRKGLFCGEKDRILDMQVADDQQDEYREGGAK